MRCTLIIGALALGLWSGSANADALYDLNLTATSDSDGTLLSTYNGMGTIDLSSAPSATGQSDYANAAVTFLIDGQTFSGSATNVRFTDGIFNNAQFSEQIGTNPLRFDLQTSSVYAFYYDNELQRASGTITSSLAPPTPAPEPLTLSLFGAGLAGAAAIRRRRKVQKA